MNRNLKMPRLGLTMTEGMISRWLKKEGETFSEGEDLAEIESDKSVAAVTAPGSGRLLKILKEEGSTVPVLEDIAQIWIMEGT